MIPTWKLHICNHLYGIELLIQQHCLTNNNKKRTYLSFIITFFSHLFFSQVRIQVLDKNDSPPAWPSTKPTSITVSENAHVGQQIAVLKATDPDTIGSISYSIVEGNDDKFEVDPSTGALRIVDTLDREKQEEWRLVVRASDGVQYSDGTVILMVRSKNLPNNMKIILY